MKESVSSLNAIPDKVMALFEVALEAQVQERQRFLKEVTTVIVTAVLRMQQSTFKKHN